MHQEMSSTYSRKNGSNNYVDNKYMAVIADRISVLELFELVRRRFIQKIGV